MWMRTRGRDENGEKIAERANIPKKNGTWVFDTNEKITTADTNRVIDSIRRERELLALGPGDGLKKKNRSRRKGRSNR